VSHHLKLLHEAQLVNVRQEGRQRFYTLDQTRVTACCNALVQQFAPNFAQVAVIPMESITVKE
jgi:DNA-binding transcriptional ArsR family regulator